MCISEKWPTALHRLSPPPASGRPRAARAGGANAGVEAARVLSGEVDAIIIDVAGREVAKCKTPVAIFATGGFGRGELAPFSDLDLLVLCAKTPGDDVQKLAEAILYPLWDAKVDAGHAVRAYDQALALPANDLAAATALLDARFLTGDQRAGRQVPGRVPGPGREDGGGGLRGAPARRAEGASQPLRRHDLSARARPQERAGRPARPVRGALGRDGALRDVRSEAAARPGRDDGAAGAGVHGRDRVADARPHPDARDGGAAAGSPALRAAGGDRADPVPGGARSRRRHPSGRPPGGRGADAPVPRARQADSQRDRAPAAARDRARGQAPEDPARDGAGRPAGRQDGRRQLRRARRRAGADRSGHLRAQAVGDDPHLPARHRPGRAAGAAHARAAGRAGRVAAGVAARGRGGGPALRPICCDTRDRANPSRLEQMQDLGMLAAIMPEWEPSTGRVQHDIYHVYTVDQHALYAVGRLHALARGDHAAAFPVPTETVPEVTRPIALAIGTLLHDVGKPYGSPHSEIGGGPGGGDLPPAGHRGGGHAAGGVPGAPAPGHGPDVAAAGSGGPGDDLGLRRGVRQRGEPARAVPADLLRSRVGRA